MGFTVHKHKRIFARTPIGKLSFVGVIGMFSAAMLHTIWSIYINSFVASEAYVSLIMAGLMGIAFCSYFLSVPIIERYDKATLLSIALVLLAIIYTSIAFAPNLWILLMLAALLTSVGALRVTSYGILVHDLSPRKKLAQNEGIIYTFLNTAFLIGPLIAGFVAGMYGTRYVFFLCSAAVLMSLFILRQSHIKDPQGKKRLDVHPIKNFTDFFKSGKRTAAYFLGSGVTIWWSFIYVFIPLFMIRQGLPLSQVGIFLFLVALPLILLEYVFSKHAGRAGFKKLFIAGYAIAALAAFAAFAFYANPYIALGILVLGSIGMAILEPTTEAYFFDILSGKESFRFYGPYNTALDVGHLLANLSASALLFLLPFKYLFVLFGSFMVLLALLATQTRNVNESKRK